MLKIAESAEYLSNVLKSPRRDLLGDIKPGLVFEIVFQQPEIEESGDTAQNWSLKADKKLGRLGAPERHRLGTYSKVLASRALGSGSRYKCHFLPIGSFTNVKVSIRNTAGGCTERNIWSRQKEDLVWVFQYRQRQRVKK